MDHQALSELLEQRADLRIQLAGLQLELAAADGGCHTTELAGLGDQLALWEYFFTDRARPARIESRIQSLYDRLRAIDDRLANERT